MADYDPIAETQQRARDLQEQRMPTGVATDPTDPIRQAQERGRAIQESILPSPGGFRGQPAQTSAQDLIDSAIAGRQEREAQRQNLINQLPYANKRQATAIHAQLHAIDSGERALEWEAGQRRIMAHEGAEEMAKRLKTDRETEIDEQAGLLMESLGKLDAMKRKGQITKDDYDSALIDYGSRYSLGTHHPGARTMLEHFVSHADKENDLASPAEARERYAKVSGDLESFQSARDAEIAKQKAENVKAGKENVPYDPTTEKAIRFEGGMKASQRELELLEQQFPALRPKEQAAQAAPKKQWKYNASTGQLE